MTLQDLKQQVMELPIADRQQLVESLLASIQQETQVGHPAPSAVTIERPLHPWTQSLVGVIKDDGKDDKETYVDYLEEKYR
jgi:Family of unknown function (DUF6364)